jgi:hypothetical protein
MSAAASAQLAAKKSCGLTRNELFQLLKEADKGEAQEGAKKSCGRIQSTLDELLKEVDKGEARFERYFFTNNNNNNQSTRSAMSLRATTCPALHRMRLHDWRARRRESSNPTAE